MPQSAGGGRDGGRGYRVICKCIHAGLGGNGGWDRALVVRVAILGDRLAKLLALAAFLVPDDLAAEGAV